MTLSAILACILSYSVRKDFPVEKCHVTLFQSIYVAGNLVYCPPKRPLTFPSFSYL